MIKSLYFSCQTGIIQNFNNELCVKNIFLLSSYKGHKIFNCYSGGNEIQRITFFNFCITIIKIEKKQLLQ